MAGAGADKAARMLDLGSNSTTAQQVAAHEQPIRCARFIEAPGTNAPMLVTGSWDKTVKYWDLRQSTAIATLECQERVYSLDVKDKLMVIATADRYINVVNLDQPTKFYKTMQSPLKWQTRVVSCFSDATGFAVGSIEGRCAIQYVEEKDSRFVRFLLFAGPRYHIPPVVIIRPLTFFRNVKQLELLLQMPPRNPTDEPRHIERLLRQRNLLPPRARHIQHRRLRRDLPLLGQRRQAPTERLPVGRGHHSGDVFQPERNDLCVRRELRLE